MTYPNAFKGVKNIYYSGILSLVVAALSILMAVLAYRNGGSGPGAVFAILVLMIILSLIVFVMNLVGICQAVRDEDTFRTARTAAIVSLILSVLSSLLEDYALLNTLLELAGKISSFICSVYVVKGIMALARKLNQTEMEERGRKLINLIIIVFSAGFVLALLHAFIPTSKAGLAFTLVLAVAILVVAIVELIMYLSYLSKAVKMLDSDLPSSPQY